MITRNYELQRTARWPALCLVVSLVLGACQSDGSDLSDNDGGGDVGMTRNENLESEPKSPLTLNLDRREVIQAVGAEPDGAASAQKFIQFEISEVYNPKKLRLTFEVHYRTEDAEETLLGTFALFPPDNPGDFIVATRGELRNHGEIALSMQVLDDIAPEDELRVTIKSISFREE